jgi:hypothetical protein
MKLKWGESKKDNPYQTDQIKYEQLIINGRDKRSIRLN